MIIEGIISIQAGDNPRVVEEKLQHVPRPVRARAALVEVSRARPDVEELRSRRPDGAEEAAPRTSIPTSAGSLTYADMITLLMALFMVLYAMSVGEQDEVRGAANDAQAVVLGAILTRWHEHPRPRSGRRRARRQAQSDLTGKDTPVPDAFAPAPVAQQTAQSAAEAERRPRRVRPS